MRSIIDKSVGLLERRCIRLNGRDPNWRGLFGEQLEEIAQASSAAEAPSLAEAV